MNFLNTLSSRLVGGLDTTSINYINKLEVATALDMCGNDLIDYDDALYGSKAYGVNAYDASSSFLVVHKSNNQPLKTSDFVLSPFKGFSIYMKYKVRDDGLAAVFSQYAVENPVVKLTSSHTEVEAGNTFEITVFQKGHAELAYDISGVTSAQLGGVSVTGTVSDMYTVLSFTLQSATSGTIVFSAGGSSVSMTITYNIFAIAKHHFDANDATSVGLQSGTDDVLSWTNQNDSGLSMSLTHTTMNKHKYVTGSSRNYISMNGRPNHVTGFKIDDATVDANNNNFTIVQAFTLTKDNTGYNHRTLLNLGSWESLSPNYFGDGSLIIQQRNTTERLVEIFYQSGTSNSNNGTVQYWGYQANGGAGNTQYAMYPGNYVITYLFNQVGTNVLNLTIRFWHDGVVTTFGPVDLWAYLAAGVDSHTLHKNPVYIGNSTPAFVDRSIDAYYYEHLMFEQSLTSEEIQLVETELIDKYYSTEASLKYHFDASVTSSVVLDGNGKVSSWVDQNIGISAIPTNASLPPLYTNSMIQIDDGTTHGLHYTPQNESSMPEGIEITLFLAFHIDTLGSDWQAIYGFGDHNSQYDKETDSHILIGSDKKLSVFHLSPSGESKYSDSFLFADNTDYVMSVKYYKNASDGNNIYIQFRINGVAISMSGSTEINTGTTELDSGQFDLFHNRVFVRTLSGKLGEFLYYEKALSTSEIQTIETSLTNKWFP
jgi:hypothetical protein